MNQFADTKSIVTSVETLRSVMKTGLNANNLALGPYKAFGHGPSALVFSGDSTAVLESETEKVWKGNKALFETLTLASVQKALMDCITAGPPNEPIQEDIVMSIFAELEDLPVTSYKVIAKLHGGHFVKIPEHTLGPFRLCVWNASLAEELRINLETTLLNFQDGQPVVIREVAARESKRAKEIADGHFRAFDNTFSFLIGRKLNTHLSAFGPKYDFVTDRISSSDVETCVMLERKDFIIPVPIDEILEYYKPFEFDRIWNLHGQATLSEIENRILNAIDWTGRANKDSDTADAFVQYIFAIEALLTHQTKGVLLTPSVGSNIADSCAFIIGEDETTRREIVRRVNGLYSRRSAIAHGGSQQISNEDLNEALQMTWDLISRLLLSPKFASFRTMKELTEWIGGRKYS